MENFLVNMAVIKVNWDRTGQAILDNYIPLVAYTLKCYNQNVISLEDFRDEFREVAEFDIPTAAVGTLLKRARRKYGFIKKDPHGVYTIARNSLPSSEYETVRNEELRKYAGLRSSFVGFCEKHLSIKVEEEEAGAYFFEILYEIAPSLFKSVSDIDHITVDKSHRRKYLVSRFISHADQSDQTSFKAIESFVRGAMLTETFYCSASSDIQGKMRNVAVYFDTTFLLRALRLCEEKYSVPCTELIDILRTMSVRMWCFTQTYNEIHGILYAAAAQIKSRGRTRPSRPGDVFDYYNSRGAKTSDVELDLATLEQKLNRIGVYVKDKSPHERNLTIDEVALEEEIRQELPTQSQQSRNHDIDCLTSIYRIRLGRPQKYIESCKAIFITTNTVLARASTRYFNRNHGVSDAAICMSDQVFTTLVWLKAVKKIPNLPRNRLVANCFAAIQPSDELWKQYIKEAEDLRGRGKIEESDFDVLIHSLEARSKLMELTLGDKDNVHGRVCDVLAEAKKKYTGELSSRVDELQTHLMGQQTKLEDVISKIHSMTQQIVTWFLLLSWFLLLLYAMLRASPQGMDKTHLLAVNAIAFWALVCVNLASVLFGIRVYGICRMIATVASTRLTNWLRKALIS